MCTWGLQAVLLILTCHSIISLSTLTYHTPYERGVKYLSYDPKYWNIYLWNSEFWESVTLLSKRTTYLQFEIGLGLGDFDLTDGWPAKLPFLLVNQTIDHSNISLQKGLYLLQKSVSKLSSGELKIILHYIMSVHHLNFRLFAPFMTSFFDALSFELNKTTK